MWLTHRSSEKEILDNEIIPTEDLFLNLKELDVINKRLGGYKVTLKGLRKIIRKSTLTTILDLGFGGGDSIKEMENFARKGNFKLFFYGVDLKKECVEYSLRNLSLIENKELICNDYRNLSVEFLNKIDIIHCSLFIHHLTDDEIVDLFKFSRDNKCKLLINDLHRNWIAYYSIKILTRIFSESRLVKNDAPLSVLRGFKKHELVKLLKISGYQKFTVKWSWAFRYLVIAE